MAILSRPNSWVTQDEATTTQLTYALQLNPAPLTVSLAGRDPVLGSLQFVLTNPTASPIAVSSVSFTMQVGTTSTNLTSSTASVGTSVSDPTDWQIQSPGTVTSGPATYTLEPQTGSSVSIATGASVTVEIFDFPTIQNPGNTTVSLKETAGSIGFTTFHVTTFPAGFYFNGLSATALNGSQLTPVAQVNAGAAVTLVWNSSVVDLGSITIFYSNAAQGQQTATPSQIGLWTSPALSTDTVFTVVITVSVQGGSPLTAALSTSVVVQNPALIAASINTGQATVSGTLGVTGASSVAGLTAASLGVSGASNLSNTTVNGTMNVTGASTVAGLTVNNALSALGLATFSGGMQLGGPLSALQDAVAIQYGVYGPAPTDGFIAAYATSAQGTGPIAPPYFAWIYASSDNVVQQATSITVPLFDQNGNYLSQFFAVGSLLLPVQMGKTFEIEVGSSPNINPNMFFIYWIPLGVAATPEQMAALRLGDAEPPKHHPVIHPRESNAS